MRYLIAATAEPWSPLLVRAYLVGALIALAVLVIDGRAVL